MTDQILARIAIGVAIVAVMLSLVAVISGGKCSGMNSCRTVVDPAELCREYRTEYRDSVICLWGRATFSGGYGD
jgi:hypothetical protein